MNKNLLRKIKALAEHGGTLAEQEAARIKLEELMAKYGITKDELDEREVDSYVFSYRTYRDKQLLLQVAYKVIPNWDGYKQWKRFLVMVCTAAEKEEIEVLHEYYTHLYEKEEKCFFIAFVQKHKLFGEHSLTPDKEQKRETLTEYTKRIQMMCSMDDGVLPYKRLQEAE
ncbi:MAG: DUF2786 domain-containing protein [Dehalococcoidia bacterium]|nr:DUF2786 domain-containing protein [Dehalococcoidia bacterium]